MKRNKLSDMEYDEISLVGRPANQESLVSFAKSATLEDSVEEDLYDETGAPVDVDELEPGDVVYTNDGQAFEFVIEEDDDEDEIGKAVNLPPGFAGSARSAAKTPFTGFPKKPEDPRRWEKGFINTLNRGRAAGAPPVEPTPEVPMSLRDRMYNFYNPLRPTGEKLGAVLGADGKLTQGDVMGRKLDRKRVGMTAAGVAGGAGLAGGGYAMSRKGREEKAASATNVLESLSKALTDADRDVVVSKAIADAEARADRAERIAKAAAEELMYAQDERLTEAYISKAAEYNLPVNPEVLGPILKSVAEVLSEDELDILDQLFSAIGDDIYREVGYVGGSSNVFDEIEATANQLVGKSDLTHEQAILALLESNPDAYTAYNAERGAL